MTTQTNQQPMLNANQRARAEIASLTDWIECELESQADENVTWVTVETLQCVRAKLIKTLAFFSNTPESMIKRSLDELHL